MKVVTRKPEHGVGAFIFGAERHHTCRQGIALNGEIKLYVRVISQKDVVLVLTGSRRFRANKCADS